MDIEGDTYTPPIEVVNLMAIRNRIILPILIVIGLISNIGCIKIVSKPKVKNNSISTHLRCIAVIDITTNLLYIPQLFYGEGCIQEQLGWAIYKAHFGSSIIYYTKFLTIHLLCSLTADRFLGIFKNAWYQSAIRHTKIRITLLGIYVTVATVPGLYWGTIERVENGWRVWSVLRIVNDAMIQRYKIVMSTLMIIVPSLLLIVMSVAITIKIRNISKIRRKQNRYRRNACAVLLLNASFILLLGMYVLIITTLQKKANYCYSNLTRETLLLGTEMLTMIWSIVNIVMFLVICKEYKKQVILSMSQWQLHRVNKPDLVELKHVRILKV